MNEISAVIDTLQARIEHMLKKFDGLEKVNRELSDEIHKLRAKSGEQEKQLAALQSANETLRHANSLLGSEENKRDTKLKINSLIREIDHCIAQLAD
ncbi:hypothetical protein [Flavobacterium silvaticum]|uniref:Uncharacterized protein n=1 Tax=Flavobacterium silvaticum TaxID=1852020 RepID=A0A972JID3_9FLAO|nr:hypothetical protein [Flavobacterium silvaticum]NMH28093.1 hypothetical protein [Flavobacterium silvaticum]